MTEFEMIKRYFYRHAPQRSEIILGNGDDCALLRSNKVLALSIDTLVLGTHFTEAMLPFDLGMRALAVNLSDCAAMGARPLAFLLALTLPQLDAQWLESFAAGLFHQADLFALPLIGGNTTRGPLSMTIQIIGELDQALKRSDAKPGDDIYVSGVLGAAALHIRPRVDLGLALQGVAHAAIDISDGLIQDLGHILEASACGAHLFSSQIPCHIDLNRALYYGEDYELCFTARPEDAAKIADIALRLNLPLTRIGQITVEKDFLMDHHPVMIKGYQHFY
jgi:thiamine-monophosphate kinase